MSSPEKYIYSLLTEIYPNYTIHEQYNIENKQRLDFFIEELNIAIEYDGIQHIKFTEYFHKNKSNFKHMKYLDKAKENKCSKYGINLIKINYKEEISKQLLIKKIEEIGLGEGSEELEKLKDNNCQSKNWNKLNYERYKQSEYYKQQIEKAKQFRRDLYLKRKKELLDG